MTELRRRIRDVADVQEKTGKKVVVSVVSAIVAQSILSFGGFLYHSGKIANILDSHEIRINELKNDVRVLKEQNERLVRLEVKWENLDKQMGEVKVLLMSINDRMIS